VVSCLSLFIPLMSPQAALVFFTFEEPCFILMKTIEYLPHIADLQVRIEADTLEKLFEAGLKGMGNVLKKDFCNTFDTFAEFDILQEISIESNEITSLLIYFLSEALTKSYVDHVLFCELSVLELNETRLIGVMHGASVKEFDEDIKAITYHETDVKKNNCGNWETRLIFEI
jgi:SHS2 domain-containing protein